MCDALKLSNYLEKNGPQFCNAFCIHSLLDGFLFIFAVISLNISTLALCSEILHRHAHILY